MSSFPIILINSDAPLVNGGSFRNDPVLLKQYNNFRAVYWKWRAKQYIEGRI